MIQFIVLYVWAVLLSLTFLSGEKGAIYFIFRLFVTSFRSYFSLLPNEWWFGNGMMGDEKLQLWWCWWCQESKVTVDTDIQQSVWVTAHRENRTVKLELQTFHAKKRKIWGFLNVWHTVISWHKVSLQNSIFMTLVLRLSEHTVVMSSDQNRMTDCRFRCIIRTTNIFTHIIPLIYLTSDCDYGFDWRFLYLFSKTFHTFLPSLLSHNSNISGGSKKEHSSQKYFSIYWRNENRMFGRSTSH